MGEFHIRKNYSVRNYDLLIGPVSKKQYDELARVRVEIMDDARADQTHYGRDIQKEILDFSFGYNPRQVIGISNKGKLLLRLSDCGNLESNIAFSIRNKIVDRLNEIDLRQGDWE